MGFLGQNVEEEDIEKLLSQYASEKSCHKKKSYAVTLCGKSRRYKLTILRKSKSFSRKLFYGL